MSKEFRLRGQVGSLADLIYIICYRGMCLRSEIKKVYSFHAIALNIFFSTKKVFQSKRVSFGRQKKIMVGFATGSHLRNFDSNRQEYGLISHQSSAKARFRYLGV